MSARKPSGDAVVQTSAVIHFGASAVTLVVGETAPTGEVSVLDYLEIPLPLARDIFRSGVVTRPVMEQAASILRDFQHSLKDIAQLSPEQQAAIQELLNSA